MGWTEAQLPDLSGRTAVVTGANSGIGYYTALALARRGCRVVLACRNTASGEDAARKIRATVEVRELDLASMGSVRAFAEQWDGPLDLLVNNAGVMAPPKFTTTVDGYELQFGTNHLGHFVLTGLLLSSLLSAAGGARVVTVSSTAHHPGTEDVLDGNTIEPYDRQKTYSNSKLANLLFAFELQREASARGLPLVSAAAHPGVSATGLVIDRQGLGASAVVRTFAPVFLRMFTQSAKAGARATLFAATEAEPGSYTGPTRFAESRGAIGVANLSDLARDEKFARRLWQRSEELTGLHFPWP